MEATPSAEHFGRADARQSDTRVNVAAILMEEALRPSATASSESALEVRPDHIAAIQGLAVLAVRAGEREPRLAEWLARIAVEGEDAAWREWARGRLVR